MQTTVKEPTDPIPVILNTNIGDCVRAWREYRGLRPSALAEKARVSRSYISSLEHNVIKNPNKRHLIRIADALDIDVITLLNCHLPPIDSDGTTNERPAAPTATDKPISPPPITLSAEIERRINAAHLSDQEVQIIVNSLLSATDQMLKIATASRGDAIDKRSK